MAEPSMKLRVSAYAVPVSVPTVNFGEKLGLPELTKDRKHVVLGEDGERGRYVVAYDFGAVIFIGETEAAEKQLLELWFALSGKRTREPTTEDFTIVVEPGSRVVATFDAIQVPEITTPLVDIVALVVGQSVAMEHIEPEVDATLLRLETYSEALRLRGDYRGTKRELLRFIGTGLSLSNRAVLTLSILDPPLASWNDETLDRAHRVLRDAFGIEERYRALDHKLTKIQGSLELLVDLVQHKRAQLLEGVVIALIAVEIVLFFVERYWPAP
jgi:uncharacterized Rmd1/YagE family protein